MLSRSVRRGLTVLGLMGFARSASLACTFPSVDYADADADASVDADADARADDADASTDAGADAEAPASCSVTGPCADMARQCGENARKMHTACTNKCTKGKDDPMCVDFCNKILNTGLGNCKTACQSCGQQQGCTNAAMSCAELVGGG